MLDTVTWLSNVFACHHFLAAFIPLVVAFAVAGVGWGGGRCEMLVFTSCLRKQL